MDLFSQRFFYSRILFIFVYQPYQPKPFTTMRFNQEYINDTIRKQLDLVVNHGNENVTITFDKRFIFIEELSSKELQEKVGVTYPVKLDQ
jgi:hypothetical protein